MRKSSDTPPSQFNPTNLVGSCSDVRLMCGSESGAQSRSPVAVSYNNARPTVALQVQIPDKVCLCSAIDENHSLSLQYRAYTMICKHWSGCKA